MNTHVKTRKIVVGAMMSAIAALLMFLEFSVPVMPAFIKFDFSELPALITSFALGPIWGVFVCLVKNLINITHSSSGGVGELVNFIVGASFVFTAGLIYQKSKTKKHAITGGIIGSIVMAAVSFPVNYYITYPIYAKFMPIDQILAAYQKIFGGVNSLAECLLVFNLPFTLLKGLVVSLITILIYKRLSPILKGNK